MGIFPLKSQNEQMIQGFPVNRSYTKAEADNKFGGGGVTLLTTKGDLFGYSNVNARVGVGSDGQILSADSSQATGLKWIAASGTGTVTASGGSLTANAVVLGAGTTDTKVVAGVTTDGVSQINLGVNTTTLGKLKMFGNTSGDATIQPAAVAGTATVLTLPIVTGTLATLGGTETFTNKTLTSPTLTTPVLGTPTSGTLTNCTGLPVSGITASTVTALGVGSIELGAASDTTLARVSAGVASIEGKNIALNGTGEVLTTGTIELGAASDTTIARSGAGAITVEGVQVVLAATSPTLATITTTGNIELGNASDTTLSRSAGGVLAVEGVVIPSISSTNTLTNKRVTKRTASTAGPGATPTINTDNSDVIHLTALATAITSMTTNLSGTPVEGDSLRIDFTDNGTARAITWGTSFEASTVALPTTTVISTRLDVGFFWNTATSKWRCVAVA